MTGLGGNLAAVMEARAADGGWSEDVAFLAGDRAFSHAEVHDGAARAASLLAGLGTGPGDRVLIALSDGVAFAWAFLGAIRLGGVAVPVNPRLTEADHRFAAEDTAARVAVCGDDLASRFAGRPVVGAGTMETMLAGLPPREAAPVGPGQAAYAQYTSGTTGRPKAALHGHGDPLAYFDAFARRAIALDRADVVLSVSKLYFAYGLGNSLFFPLLAGARAVLHADHPRPGDIADLVERHRVTVLYAVPTFYAHLVAAGRDAAMGSVRVAVSAGEPLVPALAGKARAILGCPILDGIGSTEVGQTFASNTLGRWEDGTVGRALPPYRVSVRDADGREMAPGQVGDLWVDGPTVGLGYLNRPGAAELVDGWLRTGDRAELDRDGVLRLHGRSDDLELVGGISVSPVEVEAVLATHPSVLEVAVAGRIGADGASQLHAFVVPAAAGDAMDGLVGDLVDLARSQLAPFKVPRSVVLVDALPRTSTGKLRRFVLRGGDWPPPADGEGGNGV
jgi:fatty acid CoA ligase FadD22